MPSNSPNAKPIFSFIVAVTPMASAATIATSAYPPQSGQGSGMG